MKTSIKLGSIYGIPVKLHFTLIFIVALIAWSVGANVYMIAELLNIPDPDIPLGLESYLLGIAVAVSLFASVFVHELAHSIVSIKSGFPVEEISLWLFGGVSKMEELPTDPNLEIRISAVGPLSSLGIAFGTLAAGLVAPNDILIFLLIYTSFLNFFLAGFNLIPAFPMDGGRILRALLAKRYSYIKATKQASTIGKVFAVIFGVIGLFINVFLVLIAFFIYIAASQESQNVLIDYALSDVPIAKIMTKDVKTIDPDETIAEFMDKVTTHQHTGFPVVTGNKIVGIITLDDAKKIPERGLHTTRVKEVMETDIVCLQPYDDASKAWKTMTKKRIGRFPILYKRELVGIVTRSDIMQAFQIQSELGKYKGEEI